MINDAHVSWKSWTPLQGPVLHTLIIPHLKCFMSVCGLMMFADVRALFFVPRSVFFFAVFTSQPPLIASIQNVLQHGPLNPQPNSFQASLIYHIKCSGISSHKVIFRVSAVSICPICATPSQSHLGDPRPETSCVLMEPRTPHSVFSELTHSHQLISPITLGKWTF